MLKHIHEKDLVLEVVKENKEHYLKLLQVNFYLKDDKTNAYLNFKTGAWQKEINSFCITLQDYRNKNFPRKIKLSLGELNKYLLFKVSNVHSVKKLLEVQNKINKTLLNEYEFNKLQITKFLER